MALDPVVNFGVAQINGKVLKTDLTINLVTGQGANLPLTAAGAFNAPIWDSSVYGGDSTAAYLDGFCEIVRVTANASDILTVTRAQEGTVALDFNIDGHTYSIGNALTAKMITDIAAAIASVKFGDPSTRYFLEEDFDGGTAVSGNVGRNSWGFSGASSAFLQPKTVGARGEWMVKTSTGSSALAELYFPSFSDQTNDGLFLGNEAFDLKIRVALTNTGAPATGHKNYMFGVAEVYDPGADTQPKGMYFWAHDAGTIQAVCSDGTLAQTDTSVAQSSSYVDFEIVSTGSSVAFYVAGVLKATITTNIPTTGMKFFFYVQTGTDGVAKEMHVDYLWCNSLLTR